MSVCCPVLVRELCAAWIHRLCTFKILSLNMGYWRVYLPPICELPSLQIIALMLYGVK